MSTTIDRPFKSKITTTPARQALADAHADLRTAQATLDGLDAAIAYDGNASKAVHVADAALEAAEADFVRVQQAHTDALIRPDVRPALTMQAARQKVEDAKTELADAEAARASLRSRQQSTETARDKARQKVNDAAITVLRDHWASKINSFLAELDTLHHQIAERGQLLDRLVVDGIIPGKGPSAPEGVIELRSRYFDSPPASWTMSRRPMPSQIALADTLAALKSDPHAKLPD